KSAADASAEEMNLVIGQMVTDSFAGNRKEAQSPKAQKRRAYYLSAEFLMGRAIINNLISLGLYDKAKSSIDEFGSQLTRLKHVEDAGLGNGGLGRLAACFMDSAATLAYPVMGYGIRYKYGIFKQNIVDGEQVEAPDNWTAYGDPWAIERPDESVTVEYDDMKVLAVPYDIPVYGYKNNYAVTVRLWEASPLVPFDFEKFNAQNYNKALENKNEAENISRVLYPADDKNEGKLLRLRQEYFFTYASLKDVIRGHKRIHGNDFTSFSEENVFQLNDTHPVIAIPVLLYILCEEEGLSFADAFDITGKVFAYTNHTIMAEALESWSDKLFKSILGKIYVYITKLDDMLKADLQNSELSDKETENMHIISRDRIYMANIAMYMCTRVNGVAKLHTDIIKSGLFASWNKLYPGKIINVTNGITQRRWLGVANPELAGFVSKLIEGDGWLYDLTKLKKIAKRISEPGVVTEFNGIKSFRRRVLSDHIYSKEGIRIDPDGVYDVQIKRIHEYKRQLMNALSALQMYFDIKDGVIKPTMPVNVLIGGKAAPGYKLAKDIIRLICEIEKLILSDDAVSKYLKLHFITGYNVSYAEMLVAAADISEQISTAGCEASGTGNMKMMLNGALTLGTLDGANVEIVNEAGRENNYIFGATVEELDKLRVSYDPHSLYENDIRIKRLLDFINGSLGNGASFTDLYDSLLNVNEPDRYFVLKDFDSYHKTRLRAIGDFGDRERTGMKALYNISAAGVFSSDRSVVTYAEKVWKIKPDTDFYYSLAQKEDYVKSIERIE
ncbi:MAG: glycogen/starch/alpha-glucan phosphorylase, partial [Clostridia bacterium]|nr:glycogen/starch/alpha-glucan phosphorylase [Clostridia bacterium]